MKPVNLRRAGKEAKNASPLESSEVTSDINPSQETAHKTTTTPTPTTTNTNTTTAAPSTTTSIAHATATATAVTVAQSSMPRAPLPTPSSQSARDSVDEEEDTSEDEDLPPQDPTQAKQAQVAFNLARNYLDEYSAASTTRDRQSSAHKAVKFLTQAADKCSVDAMLMLYEVYQGLRLDGIFKDDADPLMWLKQAAKRGHHVAQHNMGFTAQKKKKISLALKWYSRAAAQGIPESMYALVKIYWEDKNDHKTAVEWAIKAFKSATAGQWKNDILAAHVCESIAGIEQRLSPCVLTSRNVGEDDDDDDDDDDEDDEDDETRLHS